jgi:hypothetical protein
MTLQRRRADPRSCRKRAASGEIMAASEKPSP